MKSTFLFQPFRFGTPGGAGVTDDADRHLRDKILAVLFTRPGERVNNPRFGVGLNRAVFESLDELGAAAIEYQASQGLRRDLGEDILIDDVNVALEPERGMLVLEIGYRRREDRVRRRLEVAL